MCFTLSIALYIWKYYTDEVFLSYSKRPSKEQLKNASGNRTSSLSIMAINLLLMTYPLFETIKMKKPVVIHLDNKGIIKRYIGLDK